MNDFNLRPEIMGFGRPERVLATPAPTLLPADQWKPHGKSFEVNGLGQLRTALALPAPEAEIAASMRHADAAPMAKPAGLLERFLTDMTAPEAHINRSYKNVRAAFDPAAEGGDKTSIFAPFKSNAMLEKLRDDVLETMYRAAAMQASPQLIYSPNTQTVAVVSEPTPPLLAEHLQAMQRILDEQEVPQRGRAFWHSGMLHTGSCACDGCTALSLGGRFSSTKRIMADKPRLSTSQAAFDAIHKHLLPQAVNYTARYMAMTDAELDATRHVPQECDEDGEAFRRELRIRKL